MNQPQLLAGPDPRFGMEPLASHTARLGPLPSADHELITTLERSGLRGRGGAGFPVGTKWRSVAARSRGRATVLVNGAEGEPLSHKDRLLMESRPHLVIDGAVLAAEAVGAREVVLYLGVEHGAAAASMQRALTERSETVPFRTLRGPATYVAGEESAAVHFVDDGVALPTTVPPRPFERGVGGRPTLVQNVESLAHAALIARHGAGWFQALGAGAAAGTLLTTISGAVAAQGVFELAQGTPIGAAVDAAGGLSASAQAVLLGGYFGGWVGADQAWPLGLDGVALKAQGHSLGCGVVSVLPQNACGVVETAKIIGYLADQSARQCGPCVFGLRAIAMSVTAVAARSAHPDELRRLRRWAEQLGGRGACKHPDGAAAFLLSGLRVFEAEFALHQRRRCSRLAGKAAGAA